MIDRLLPVFVAAEESFDDDTPVALYEDESAALAGAPDERRREFATARLCARRALVRLGVAPVAILPDDAGAPRWPAGIIGSLTHCRGYRAVCLARADDATSIGIDAEPHEPLPEGLADSVAFGAEPDRIVTLTRSTPSVHWDRVLFSAKESVYKAWFPLARVRLGFEQADVTLDTNGTFAARLLVPASAAVPDDVSGRWQVDRGLVTTAVAI